MNRKDTHMLLYIVLYIQTDAQTQYATLGDILGHPSFLSHTRTHGDVAYISARALGVKVL